MEELFEAKASMTLQQLLDGTKSVLPTAVHNAGNDILIDQLSIIPMLGVKSLQISCLTKSADSDGGAYSTRITFYDVEDGDTPNSGKNPVRVGCGCQAYYFYFAYPNFLKDAHLGNKPRPYTPVANPKRIVPPKNPDNIPGACKHILALALAMQRASVIDD